MQFNTLTATSRKTRARRVGRGGAHGKTSGRGHKGQKARAGHHIRPALRDIIKRIPKRRGHGKNRARTINSARVSYVPINLTVLERTFAAGDTVSPQTLLAKGLLKKRGTALPLVKILGTGTLSKKLTVERCAFSVSAKAAIEKVQGIVKSA